MSILEVNNRLKHLRNNYRLVIMNEDANEELIRFRLSRLSVYIAMSSLFVFLVAITASLIIFTPLKYYLPGVGYGNVKQIKEYKILKLRTDSMENALIQQHKYIDDITSILKGNPIKKDTNKLKIKSVENIDD